MKDFANVIYVGRVCPFCGNYHRVVVKEEDYWAYEDGELIQNAFPYLTADEREIIKTGICPDCWDNMFKGV